MCFHTLLTHVGIQAGSQFCALVLMAFLLKIFNNNLLLKITGFWLPLS